MHCCWQVLVGISVHSPSFQLPAKGVCLLIFFKLWNEEYRDGIKTRGDKIGMVINDVRGKLISLQTTMPTDNTSHKQIKNPVDFKKEHIGMV